MLKVSGSFYVFIYMSFTNLFNSLKKRIEKISAYIVNNKRNVVAYLGLFAMILIGTVCYAEDSSYIFSETEDRIYMTLRAAGYTKAGACGILGNISVENPKFQADLSANGGLTYGLFQWNSVGERKESLVKWCNNRKLYHNRADGQLAFALHELDGGDGIAKRVNEFLKTTDNPRNAAMEFAVGFERCVGHTSNKEIDAEYDGFIYPEYFGRAYQALGKRMDNAEMYFEAYPDNYFDQNLIYIIGITPTPGLIAELENTLQIDLERSLNIHVGYDNPEKGLSVRAMRFICMGIGYFCGCMYFALFFIDRKKLKANSKHKMKTIPHGSSVFSRMGAGKASLFFINDIFKLLLAIAISSVAVKGLHLDEKIIFTGLGVVIGNAYPYWNKFSGGLGFTVTIILLILYMPIWGVLCCVIGMYFAYLSKSLTVGVVLMSMLMIPFTYHYKSTTAAIVVAAIMLTLVVSHQRLLLKYIDRNVLHAYYSSRRRRVRNT